MNSPAYCFAILVIAISANLAFSQEDDPNSYIDKALDDVRKDIQDQGFDPYEILNYTYKGFLVTVHLDGYLHNLSTIHRVENATYVTNNDTEFIKSIFGVRDLKAELNYKIESAFFPITGKAGGKVSLVTVRLSMEANKLSGKVKLTRCRMNNIGKVNTEVKVPFAFEFVNFVISKVSDAIVNFYRNMVARLFEENICKFIQDTVNKLDFDNNF